MTRNNTSTITRHNQRHTDGSKSWIVQNDSTIAQKYIKKFETLTGKLQNETAVVKNLSATSGLGKCSKSSNRDSGLNHASYEGSYVGSEANSCPDEPKTTEDEPPSKMQNSFQFWTKHTARECKEQTTKLYLISEGTKYNDTKQRTKHGKHEEYVAKDIDIGGCQQENRQCACTCSVRS
ncbi:Hypothetical predicted protein [Paramuricea clavata]|uniref:Uncharacterized protein n=1 Tax=Paramuricea clavata TaxID=317549 RepID=A0A6S7I3H7_PARCT|nr:Hypothetical predicted protein [Paramuricea clavata]